MSELTAIARDVITANLYLALGTADASGTPWVSPVYYTPEAYSTFYWVSSPDTRHSRNIAMRPEVSIAIYDSHAQIGRAEAVYMTAVAAQVPDEELPRAAALYNDRLPESKHFKVEELLPPSLFRLYRANATEHSALIRGGDPKYGRGADSRLTLSDI